MFTFECLAILLVRDILWQVLENQDGHNFSFHFVWSHLSSWNKISKKNDLSDNNIEARTKNKLCKHKCHALTFTLFCIFWYVNPLNCLSLNLYDVCQCYTKVLVTYFFILFHNLIPCKLKKTFLCHALTFLKIPNFLVDNNSLKQFFDHCWSCIWSILPIK